MGTKWKRTDLAERDDTPARSLSFYPTLDREMPLFLHCGHCSGSWPRRNPDPRGSYYTTRHRSHHLIFRFGFSDNTYQKPRIRKAVQAVCITSFTVSGTWLQDSKKYIRSLTTSAAFLRSVELCVWSMVSTASKLALSNVSVKKDSAEWTPFSKPVVSPKRSLSQAGRSPVPPSNLTHSEIPLVRWKKSFGHDTQGLSPL